MSFDKNENHGLEMHVKSFEVFLVNALFFYPYPPHTFRGGGVVAGLIIVLNQVFPLKF